MFLPIPWLINFSIDQPLSPFWFITAWCTHPLKIVFTLMFMSVSSILSDDNIQDLILPSKISMIHGVSVPCDWAPRYACFIRWKNLKIAHFVRWNPLSSVWSMVLVSLATELQGMCVLLDEKIQKVHLFFHWNPFSSAWSMVLASLVTELQGTCVLLDEKIQKVHPFFHWNPFSSVWSIVLVSLAPEFQGTCILLDEKNPKSASFCHWNPSSSSSVLSFWISQFIQWTFSI